MIIQPIVEGPGDIEAVPLLIRRICYELGCSFDAIVAPPMKVQRGKMVQEESIRQYVRIASLTPGCNLILLFTDTDDDCAKEISELLHPWIRREGIGVPCEIIAIPREYECWFIAAAESLRGVRGIRGIATSHHDPESVRNPKKLLSEWMAGTTAYHETADLTQRVDLEAVRTKCRSFRRLVQKIQAIADLTNLE
jgi:hypothetical protein